MKMAMTVSSNEWMNANSDATRKPGRSTGRVTWKKVRSGPAPALMAARSRFRSNPLSVADTIRNATGTDTQAWAMMTPTWLLVRPTGLKKA